MSEIITLDHGSGGEKTSGLVKELVLKYLGNSILDRLEDAALIRAGDQIVFSTDSFVIDPLFFPGGNIGKLCVCGTANDVCMRGGKPYALSLGLILEEGFPVADLEKILASIAETAGKAGVLIVTGDTKVVEKGKGDGIYINTAGIGLPVLKNLGTEYIREGDAILVSGTVGDHGAAVMLARNEGLLAGEIRSDCGLLTGLAEELYKLGDAVRIMRDPTRGGLATVMAEFAEETPFLFELEEDRIPIREDVRSACDILGLDPLYCACEGRLVAVVDGSRAEEAAELLRSREEGRDAAVIGRVVQGTFGKVVLKTAYSSRVLTKLSGMQLPRIC